MHASNQLGASCGKCLRGSWVCWFVVFWCLGLPVARGQTSPAGAFATYPVPEGDVQVVSNATPATAGEAEKVLYDNPLGHTVAEIPAQVLISDDIKLAVATGCALRRYTVQVIGKANPNACGGQGISCGPVRIDFGLYNECPNAGGTLVDGTLGCVTNAPDAYPDCMVMDSEFSVTEVEFVPTIAVSLPSSVWLGVKASRASTGVVIGAPALTGYSGDVFDTVDFPCNSSAGGFPAQPHASFHASIYGAATCPDTCLVYQNIRSSQSGINAGANNCIADDIQLDHTCQLAEMELGLRGAGIYDIELRRNVGGFPEGGCVGGSVSMGGPAAIPGTHQRFLLTSTGLTVKRFTFNPPIQLPSTRLFAVLVPNNINATWILTQRNASVGATSSTYDVWDVDAWKAKLPASNLYGGMQITLTCADACPLGACCDHYLRDENNEAVCREVPRINCAPEVVPDPLPLAWQEGESCRVCDGGGFDGEPCQSDADCGGAGTCVDNDQLRLPCDVGKCCFSDGRCDDLPRAECPWWGVGPDPWHAGESCALNSDCPISPCFNARGDCYSTNFGTCNGGPDDGAACTSDADCESHDNGVCVDIAPQCVDGEHDGEACITALDCIPGGFCAESVCVGGARDGKGCGELRDCRESFCPHSPGCNDPFCCSAVCRYSPGPPMYTDYCCDVHWDQQCVELAQSGLVADCHEPPPNDHCAPSWSKSGATRLLVDGPEGRTNTALATVDSGDGFCCNAGIGRCDGGCLSDDPLGKACDDDADCLGTDDGYCDFPPDYSRGYCTAGCNAGKPCLDPEGNLVETLCVDGPNSGAPCKPRCVGGTLDGQPCGNVDQCPGGSACDGTGDCGAGHTCDNSFCEGSADGVCVTDGPEPGGTGVGSVWYYFTVPDNGVDDTMNIEVSTCGSRSPATDSLLQVFATKNLDAGKCDDNLGKCSDGSYCDRVLQGCADQSTCVATSLACSVSAQDCPIATSTCQLDLTTACSKLSPIGCSDDAGAAACGSDDGAKLSQVCLPNLERGYTYFILVSAKTYDANGEYRVRVSSVSSCEPDTAPANDFCSKSIALPVVEGDTVVPFALDGATFDCQDEPCNANLRNDIWYTWTAPENQVGTGNLSIKTCGDGEGPPPDTELMIYHGCGCPAPTSPQPLCFSAGTDPTCMPSASTYAPIEVQAGDCLTIRLGDNQGLGGQGEMTVTYTPAPRCERGDIDADDPPDGTIDAGWSIDCNDGGDVQGIHALDVYGPPDSADPSCWSLCESSTAGAPNTIEQIVEYEPAHYRITLSHPITPGQCTSLVYNAQSGSPSTLTYAALPGDVDGNGTTNGQDILAIIDILNGAMQPPWGNYSADVDRSAHTNATDVLAVIDLLRGAGACASWNNVSLPEGCGQCPDLPGP